MCIKIIIGIGNYINNLLFTRHNVGIWWINKIINNEYFKNIIFGKLYNLNIKKKNIYFYVPKTYINNVGKYIYKIKNKLNLKNNEILIIHDEININKGNVKIKNNFGKKSTHNGIKNILKYLKKDNFYQLRIGIGKPKKKKKLKDYVLSEPNYKEKYIICKSIKKSIKYIKILIKNNNFKFIQNILNSKINKYNKN